MKQTITLDDIKEISKVDYYQSDYRINKAEIRQYYVTPCHNAGYDKEYWTKETLLKEHLKCKVCNFKFTKQKKLTDTLLLKIFEHDIKPGRDLKSRNYTIEYIADTTILRHNREIECIRRQDGLVIHNSEHIAFRGSPLGQQVSCPRFYNMSNSLVEIPLTTIAREYYHSNNTLDSIPSLCQNITILDNQTNGYIFSPKLLFKVTIPKHVKRTFDFNDKYEQEVKEVKFKKQEYYFLHARDERHMYLVELQKPFLSVESAEQSLMPDIAVKSGEYIRQGDLFFIPVELPDNAVIEKQKFTKCYTDLIHGKSDNREVIAKVANRCLNEIHEKREQIESYNISEYFMQDLEQNRETHIEKFGDKITPLYNFLDDLLLREKGTLYKIQIYETNHNAQFSTNLGMTQIVKGWITHNNKDHHRIKLEEWNLVVFNQQKNSFMVDAASGGGRD